LLRSRTPTATSSGFQRAAPEGRIPPEGWSRYFRGKILCQPNLPKNLDKERSSASSDRLREALLSIGVDRKSAEKLVSSRALERIVVPIYWKDGLVLHGGTFWLSKLPEFLKGFEEEFPDGKIGWDTEYFELNPKDGSGDVAIRVVFNLQEGDQGEHFAPKPTELEEESYQGMLNRLAFKGRGPVQAHSVLQG